MRDTSYIRLHWFARLLLWGGWRLHARWIGLVVAGSVLQGVVAPRIAIGTAMPDLTLLALACIALRTNPTISAWAGFLSGLIEASIQDQLMGSLIISRVVAASLTAFLPMVMAPDRRLSAVASITVLSVLAQGLFYLFAPSAVGVGFVRTILQGLVYNIGVVLLAFGLFRRLLPSSLLEDDRRYGTFNL
ncbi:MAG: hypothetical protein C4336_01430 [Armatimonadota bacterium]